MTIEPRVEDGQRLPNVNAAGFYEMRFESIGGLGANLAAKMLAETIVLKHGFNGVNWASYGAEKKGAPIKAFLRVSAPERPVRTSSPVDYPHLLVVFHEILLHSADATSGLRPDATVVVNTRRTPHEVGSDLGVMRGAVVAVDAMGISVEENTRLNTPMLGAIGRAAGFVDRDLLRETIAEALGARYPKLVAANVRAFDRGWDEVKVALFVGDGEAPLPQPRSIAIGFRNAPIGGTILAAGSSVLRDMSHARQGFVPVLQRPLCNDCGLCELTCPDYAFVWEERLDTRQRPVMSLVGIDYQYCKGCLKCVEICPLHALTKEPDEPQLVQAHRVSLLEHSVHPQRFGAQDIDWKQVLDDVAPGSELSR